MKVHSCALPLEVVEEIDAILVRKRKESPGLLPNKSDVLRTLIIEGIRVERKRAGDNDA